MKNIPNKNIIVIKGDLKVKIGSSIIPAVKQKFYENIQNEDGQSLINF